MKTLVKAFNCLQYPLIRGALIKHLVAGTVEHVVTLRKVKPQLVIDVGANKGQFAIAVASSLPEADIISFEPLPPAAIKYRKVMAHCKRARLIEAALSPVSGNVNLHVSNKDDSSSLLPIAENQSKIFPNTHEIGLTQVRAGPLYEFISQDEIQPRSLLKIDVQGFELDALRACEIYIHKISHIYVECSFVELYTGQALANEVISYLDKLGFKLQEIRNLYVDRAGRSIQADFLFLNSAEII